VTRQSHYFIIPSPLFVIPAFNIPQKAKPEFPKALNLKLGNIFVSLKLFGLFQQKLKNNFPVEVKRNLDLYFITLYNISKC